jgi:hypothetical protein
MTMAEDPSLAELAVVTSASVRRRLDVDDGIVLELGTDDGQTQRLRIGTALAAVFADSLTGAHFRLLG